jgi:heptaprenyl diphosphate synthase
MYKAANVERKQKKYLVLFLLLALYLSVLETLIPKPVPWFKIGFANMVTLLVMKKFGFRMAVQHLLLRVLIQNLTFGTILTPTFVISLTAGLAAVFVMGGLFRRRQSLSFVSISIVSAVVHNFVQLLIVYLLFFQKIELYSRYTFLFILFFLSLGIVSGGITGVLSERIKLRTLVSYKKGEQKKHSQK